MKRFNLPQNCQVNKIIPKKALIAQSPQSKKSFANIEKIRWLYKLSPSTLHIPKEGKIEEIQIFALTLKSNEQPKEAIKRIKKLIPYPILFEIHHKESFCYATYLIGEDRCFFSAWDEVVEFNFTATNLEKLYESMVKKFLNSEVLTPRTNLKDAIDKSYKIELLSKEIEALKKKIDREKQFKKKLELSRILKPKEEELLDILKKQSSF